MLTSIRSMARCSISLCSSRAGLHCAIVGSWPTEVHVTAMRDVCNDMLGVACVSLWQLRMVRCSGEAGVWRYRLIMSSTSHGGSVVSATVAAIVHINAPILFACDASAGPAAKTCEPSRHVRAVCAAIARETPACEQSIAAQHRAQCLLTSQPGRMSRWTGRIRAGGSSGGGRGRSFLGVDA
jgi:hypothetical protein